MARGGYRVGAGRPKGSRNKKKEIPTNVGKDKQPETPTKPEDKIQISELTPLEHMLAVINDPKADIERKDKMAIAAAPFFHGKLSLKGKKQDRQEKALKAGSGRFKPGKPPTLKVLK